MKFCLDCTFCVFRGHHRALLPEHRHDADAITSAIANMKQDLRSGDSDDNGPAAA
jgi:hypothetical protein